MKRAEKWYTRRLAAYFERWYGRYEDEVEFYTDPAINMWLLDIPSMNIQMCLTCDEDGIVSERRSILRGDEPWPVA